MKYVSVAVGDRISGIFFGRTVVVGFCIIFSILSVFFFGFCVFLRLLFLCLFFLVILFLCLFFPLLLFLFWILPSWQYRES